MAACRHAPAHSDREHAMPHLTTDDGVKLYYEQTGGGIPIVFVHEFAGDHRAWEAEASAKQFETRGMEKQAEAYGLGPTRVQFQNKDPRGWQEFLQQLKEHSTEGAVGTLRGVQARRPSLYDLVDKMKTITAPALVMTGDEDWPCLEPGILMKQTIPTAALLVMPNAGHGINTEDPGAFNAHLADFFHTVDLGKWPARVARRGMSGGKRLGNADRVSGNHHARGVRQQ